MTFATMAARSLTAVWLGALAPDAVASDASDPRAYAGPLAISGPETAERIAPTSATPARTPAITPPRLRPATTPQPSPTRAVEPERAVRMRPAIDISITLGTAAPSLALGLFITPYLPGPVVMPGPGDEVGRMDQVAIGRFDPQLDTVADALLGVSVAAPVAYHAIEAALYRRGYSTARGRGFLARYGTDLVLYSEALAITALLTQILKASVRRPRPYAYMDPDDVDPSLRPQLIEAQNDHDADWSFPSGHASTAFVASTAGATLLTLEMLGRRKWPIVLAWVGGTGIAATTGAMRILGGKHFPSDVLTSALIGSAVGVVVPLAHWRPTPWGDVARRPRERLWALSPMATRGFAGMQVRGSFSATPRRMRGG